MKTSNPETVKKAKEITKKRFWHTNLSHKAVQDLFKICVRKEAKKIDNNLKKGKKELPVNRETFQAKQTSEPVDPNDLLRDKVDLPSLPDIFSRIVEIMSDPISSADDFANVIQKDPALTARLLKVVNSAFYGFGSKIGTISRAVAIIGTKELYALCLGTSVMTIFRDIPNALVNMPSFWKHSIACGVVAKLLAQKKNIFETERFFVAGLLHDIGRLIIFKHLPEHANQTLALATESQKLLFETENEVLGFDHAKAGGILIKKWKLPEDLGHMIRFHHAPENAYDQTEAAVIHLADIMVNALQIGSSGERFVSGINPAAWKAIELPETIFSEILDEAYLKISELTGVLVSDTK